MAQIEKHNDIYFYFPSVCNNEVSSRKGINCVNTSEKFLIPYALNGRFLIQYITIITNIMEHKYRLAYLADIVYSEPTKVQN